jgi:DNA-binding NarL/FixJ family response regulator
MLPLSRREQEVLVLLRDGASNKQIATSLDISVHTAKVYVAAITQKLNVRSRVGAALWAALYIGGMI